MVEMMEVFVKSENKYEEVRVIGEYGTFNDPIVLHDGKEKVAELVDMSTGYAVCQSNGCIYCQQKGCGCRLYADDDSLTYCI